MNFTLDFGFNFDLVNCNQRVAICSNANISMEPAAGISCAHSCTAGRHSGGSQSASQAVRQSGSWQVS